MNVDEHWCLKKGIGSDITGIRPNSIQQIERLFHKQGQKNTEESKKILPFPLKIWAIHDQKVSGLIMDLRSYHGQNL